MQIRYRQRPDLHPTPEATGAKRMKCCEVEQLTPYNCTPCSGGPGPPRAGAGLTALPRHASSWGRAWRERRKEKQKRRKRKGLLDIQKLVKSAVSRLSQKE